MTTPDPVALFVPEGMDSAAEWQRCNLFGTVRCMQEPGETGIRSMKETACGFEVAGTVDYRGPSGSILYSRRLFMEVDVEEGLAVIESTAVARSSFLCLFAQGLSFAVVNDRFNGYERTYHFAGGSSPVRFDPAGKRRRIPGGRLPNKVLQTGGWTTPRMKLRGRWINVDDRLGVVHRNPEASEFVLRREPERNTAAACLHFDEVCAPDRRAAFRTTPGQVLFDTGVLLIAGTAARTAEFASEHRSARWTGLSAMTAR